MDIRENEKNRWIPA